MDEHFVFALPEGLDPAGAAPLLCGGIATFSPLRRFGAGPGTKVGIVGLGGLGLQELSESLRLIKKLESQPSARAERMI